MTDEQFLKGLKIDSTENSQANWKEWRSEDIERLEAQVQVLRTECNLWHEQYGKLMNLKNVWRFVAISAIGLTLMVMFLPRPR